MSTEETQDGLGDIAIVGMAGRFPLAKDVEEFWKNIREGRECISFFSDEELLEAGVPREVFEDEHYVPAWGWMEGVDLFDAEFFDITPREAEVTDPQIRILLECAWESLENAGCDPSRYPGRIGVFAGSSMMFYLWQNLVPTPGLLEKLGFVQAWIVNDRDFVATRVNYKLDLKGPGMTVQTACSTSLVATHLGIQSLLSGESDMVLCGGVSAPTPYKEGYTYMEGGTMTPDGHVRTFDARAKGMLGGNGCALVVLKRLEDAIADGDNIRAVIKGTALNNDGIDKVTYTAPSVDGQSQVILDALDVAGVDPRTISYVEAHGTGTPLGDPIEIAALTQAWRTKAEGDLGKGWCPIGAVKTNIGHLDTAAGIAGIVKTVLAMEHKEIPPTLHFEKPNPEIDFASSPFFVNTELRDWETEHLPRRATVSSLGMGGTNAHAILEEAPDLGESGDSRPASLLVVSARSEAALEKATANLADALESGEIKLADAAFTLQTGRKAFRHRRVVVARDTASAVEALRTLDKRSSATGATMQSRRPVTFLFSGQGSQYANMARGLYETEEVFRSELDRCCELAAGPLGLDLRTLLFPDGDVEAANRELGKTQYTQPALFVVEYALAKLLASFGIEPAAMLGHSIGEYVAACLAGVFSLEDAISLVAARGRLIGSLPTGDEGGAMLGVQLAENELRAMIGDQVDFAALNSPELCVISGSVEAVARIEAALESKGIGTRRLHTSHAFHSRLMDPILDDFEAEVRKVDLHAPEARVVSCTTGKDLSEAEATDPGYWVRHLREAVRFADGVRTLVAEDCVLLEVGPGQALTSLAGLTTMIHAPSMPVIPTTRHPKDTSDDLDVLLLALGKLWMAGVDIDWDGFYAGEKRRKVILPSYPFERKRYWIERPDPAVAQGAAPTSAPALRKQPDIADWFFAPSWEVAAPPIALRDPARRWMVLSDGSAFADALIARAGETAEVYTVTMGDGYSRSGSKFTIHPSDPEQYRQLLDATAADGGEPTEIVHLWTLGGGTPETLDAEFYSLLHLAQALSGRSIEGGVRVDVVTQGAGDVLADATAAPEVAMVHGPCMTMNLELAGVSARAIDVEDLGDGSLDAIMAELGAENEHPEIAYAAGKRWVRGYVPTHLPESRAGISGLRQDAVVLVTGGLGGIGLALSEELAREAKAKLVLVSRSGLPERGAWDAWVSEHGEDDRTSRKILAVRSLEALGSEVMVVSADSADEAQMRSVVERAVERFGGVHGLIHAAGIAGAGIVELKTREQCEAVFAAKVRGTRVLERVLDGCDLDFALLCSSISSVCVGFGQVDYFSANAYLDAVAHRWHASDRTHVVAVHWDAWSEVGMAVETEIPDAMKAERAASLALGIGSDEGREAFRRILESSLPEVVVSPRELTKREDYQMRFDLRAADVEEEVEEEAGTEVAAPVRSAAPRPNLETAYVDPTPGTQAEISELWADLLGIDRVGAEDNFFELGGNSLVMMQVNVRLRAMYGVSLPIRELFELPEVRLLAERMEAIRAVTRGADEDVDDSEDVEEFTI
ncbi:MAG TPA: SDR family NAD(P)-dependent oxidoreductase [Planctomycetes bacterium]|nr:SDR family NAD(P)-dependent oxidoreductase [Planctomycetota bacterium]